MEAVLMIVDESCIGGRKPYTLLINKKVTNTIENTILDDVLNIFIFALLYLIFS